MNYTIRAEAIDDHATLHALTEAAFRNAAHSSRTEQFIVDALRARGELSVSLVAEMDGKVIGHVAVSPVTIRHRRFGVGQAIALRVRHFAVNL